MQTIQLGRNGLSVSRVCFGCFSMGGPGVWGWADIDDEESIAAVHQALDVGITFFDNAALYGLGHAEELLGKALGSRRKDVVIATKCGYWREDMWESKSYRDSSPANIKRECADSLRRLNTDYIDLYQIHWPDDKVPYDVSMRAMLDLITEGKVRYVGVSNYSVAQMEESLRAGRLTSCQLKYNMLHRDVERDVLPFCRQHGIGTISYSTLASGLLAGKYTQGATFGEKDWRPTHNPDYQGEAFTRHLQTVDRLTKIARECGKTMTQLATAWALTAVDVAIVGMKNPAQVRGGACDATGWGLGIEVMQDISAVLTGN
jgi:aryl-alcohol dehydrogenase-like predicted oxidoreductase